jgi:uncharacterized protein YndB with AHSA1/START domain
MTERSIVHATFVVERSYPAAPARVFAAWADPAIKAQWFGAPDESQVTPAIFDFRIGGREFSSGVAPDGRAYSYDAHFYEIVPNERILYAYEMQLDGARISVSLATILFLAEGAGTRLVVTEQGAFLDGLDTPEQRRSGTGGLLDQLGALLARP